MDRKPGCLAGLFQLAILDWVYDFLQGTFGFGRRSCSGCGCGVLLFVIFIVIACQIITGTNWLKLW